MFSPDFSKTLPNILNFRIKPSFSPIQVGSYEMLLSDSELVAEKAKRAGCKVRLSIYEGMFHVFQMALLVIPESRRAWKEVGKFLEIIQQGLPDSHYDTA